MDGGNNVVSSKELLLPQRSKESFREEKKKEAALKKSSFGKQPQSNASYLEEVGTLIAFVFMVGDLYLLALAIHSLFLYCDKNLQLW